MSFEFEAIDTGLWQVETQVDEIGLYRISNDNLNTLAQVGPANPRELAAVSSTDELLLPVIEATSGSLTRIGAVPALPRILAVSETASTSGTWLDWVDQPRCKPS